MPRISPRLILEAYKIHPYLPYLLPACKTIFQAKLELGWIINELPVSKHKSAIKKRFRLYPLQYILGNQPFGSNLKIECKKGVLIPRADTEEWCMELCKKLRKIKNPNDSLKVLEICSGSGCISLLIGEQLKDYLAELDILGVDVSQICVDLSQKNLELNHKYINSNKTLINFIKGDLFNKDLLSSLPIQNHELVISNPPYIPLEEYNVYHGGLEKSVIKYEPRLALVGNLEVYKSLLDNFVFNNKSCKSFIFEVGNKKQIEFVRDYILFKKFSWNVGYRIDSNGQYRNVVGWQRDCNYDLLQKMCTSIYN
ncbi:hypothetical protein PACTADRAFT_51081 [Pachysolen tannophilus NRRL Y-2460]|uniref:Uncharacterized protein n=1 Tax=Pachysolen tannophilus NRRL Y-2460 TaxID=669874 RepID=A0A1E4TR54_PACTA|nr:hypothetical protein PACTADRAFT_51081 [Pachysolen tannophilus NRRL Y-2460]